MSPTVNLPAADGRQWLRLRQLRVQRARHALQQAQQALHEAEAAAARREALIAESRDRLAALAQHWSGPGSADLPRWGSQVKAHREALEERLERDEYALLDENEAVAAARETCAQRRAELGRAQAREEAVDATLKNQRLQRSRAREHQAELDSEDARRAPH